MSYCCIKSLSFPSCSETKYFFITKQTGFSVSCTFLSDTYCYVTVMYVNSWGFPCKKSNSCEGTSFMNRFCRTLMLYICTTVPASWAEWGRALTADFRSWFSLSTQLWWNISGILGSVLGSLVKERHGLDCVQLGTPRWLRYWSISCVRRG